MRQRIVAGIDCPDDFIEGFDRLAGSSRDLAHALRGFFRLCPVLLSKFTEEGNLGQIRPEIIVDVFCNASPFFVQCGLLFQQKETPVKPPKRDIAHQGDETQGKSHKHRAAEGPGLVEERSDGETKNGTSLIPDTIAIAGLDTEHVIARGQTGVAGESPSARVDPIVIITVEAVTELDIFGCSKTESRILKLKPTMRRGKAEL